MTVFRNRYDDAAKAASYAGLEFANTYYLAYRDLAEIFREHVRGANALDFGCGTGRSTRFLRQLGFDAVGVDIAPEMVAKAKELDGGADYRIISNGDFGQFAPANFDLILSAFTFDNIPGPQKEPLFRELARLLRAEGKLVSVVSAPEIYWHEWASFTTKEFAAANRQAKSGDIVRIVTTDFADRRPMEDILCSDESYRQIYERAGLEVVAMAKPLARGDEPYSWVNETQIAPWVVWVLRVAEASA